MAERSSRLDVYFEIGDKRVFASAHDWPGWARSGRDEPTALEALLAHGPRYAGVLRGTRLGFRTPGRRVDVRVVERVSGGATTDFGAPEASPRSDARSMDDTELRRSATILRACWRAFDRAVATAEGKQLSKGPRGGGRDLDGMIGHVLGADQAYLIRLGWKLGDRRSDDSAGELERTRAAVLDALTTAARDGVAPGPRGGKRWTPRHFVRRSAWHVLDHAWEIENRIG